MKSIQQLLIFILLSLLGTMAIANGTLRGVVIDASTGETLPFVNVYVTELQSGTTTDLDGAYALDVPGGIYTLEFSFLGYTATQVSEVAVEDGQVTLLDMRMKEESEILEEVVVTATQVRNTETAILTIQKKSVNLLDGISAQTFKKIGDSDAASAIKRVTGVSVQDGKYVFVRGLGDRYTKSILNGMDIPGLDPDRNTLQMDIFPTNLIDNIIVLKSFTPNLPGDFTGGVVDIVTKDFPDQKQIQLSGGLGYNPHMHLNDDALTYKGSSTDPLGYDNGLRDLPFDPTTNIPFPGERDERLTTLTSSFTNIWGAQQEAAAPNYNMSFSAGNQINKSAITFGYNIALDYKNSTDFYQNVEYGNYLKPASTEVFELDRQRQQIGDQATNNVLLTGLIAGAIKANNHKVSLSLMRINNGLSTSGVFFEENRIANTNTLKRDNLEYTERSVTNGLLRGKHVLSNGNFDIEWKLSPTFSTIYDKDIRSAVFRTDDFLNPTQFAIEPSEGAVPLRIFRDLEEQNYSGKVDLTNKLMIGNRDAKIKYGVSATVKNRDYGILNYQFNIQQPDEHVFSGNADDILHADNIWTPESRSGVYVVGNFEPANTYEATQSIYGAYLMGEIPLSDKLKMIAGARIENFVHRYTGQTNQGDVILNDSLLIDEWVPLPSVNMVYAVDNNTNIRASFSQTLARPSFKEKSLAQIYDPLANRFFIGNLDLVTTDIRNYDLRYETFRTGGEMIAVSGFYKTFSNPIELVAFSSAAPNDITPRNVGDATIMGAEIEVRKNMGFLSEQLSGLTVGTNVTIVSSKVEMDQRENGEYQSRLNTARAGETVSTTRHMQGQSPYIINAFMGYSDIERGWDANLSYNVQGKRLAVVGFGIIPDVYEQPFHSLNCKISKKLGVAQRSTISISVDNILDAKRVLLYESYGAADQIFSQLAPRRTYSISYGMRF